MQKKYLNISIASQQKDDIELMSQFLNHNFNVKIQEIVNFSYRLDENLKCSDVLILDYRVLNENNGIIQEIRHEIPSLNIIIISENNDLNSFSEIIGLGKILFVLLPIDYNKFKQAIEVCYDLAKRDQNCLAQKSELFKLKRNFNFEISIKKQAEEEVYKFLYAIEQSPVTVLITDTKGNIQYANPKFTKVSGYSFDEVIGKNPSILKSGKQSDEVYKEMWESISKGIDWSGEFQNKRKNGELYWEMAWISAIRNKDGEIYNYLAVKEDITQRKEAEDALRKSEELNKYIISELPYSLFIHINGVIVFASKAFSLLTGLTNKELINKRILDLLDDKNIEGIKEKLKQRALGIDIPDFELGLKTKKGLKIVSVSGRRINFENQDAILVVLIDITEKKQNENLVREKIFRQKFSKQLIDYQEAERKRISAELHDGIGQDVLVIKNHALLGLHENMEKEKLIKQLNLISETASNTITEIRTISHNLRPIHLERLGLTEAIFTIIENVAKSSNIDFIKAIENIDGLVPKQMEINIYRIIQEGISNIIKHSNSKKVEILIKKLKNKIRITINDNGEGFILEKSNRNSQFGFGLSGISERVEILDGILEINSVIGRGTTVNVLIPFKQKN
ncbi:MAG: PAS domain S-box protein [Bacteroidetes bacterium]|nr:PAS domain S-box protein [Bacteroidota bacterium]